MNLLNNNPYLVTRGITPSALPQQKVLSDLEQLEKAENKSLYKTNIAKGTKNPLVYRAMTALKLANPFKGY